MVRVATSEEEQLKLERIKKYHPPTFSGLASENAHGFLEEGHRILHTMGIVKTSGVAFTTFQLKGVANHDLSTHAPALFATVRERVRRFIERLNQSIRFSMARELESDTPYQQVVEIARRGYVSRSVHEALPASNGASIVSRPQVAHFAQPFSSAPPARDAFSDQSNRPCPSQSQPPRPPRAYFECGDARHMVRDCPRLIRGAPSQTTQAPRIQPGPQTSQAMIVAPVAAPPAQPARGRGRAGIGLPRGEGQTRYYALPSRTEVVASDSVITCIVPVCHRKASVLFDPGSTYSYVSSYFAPYLGISRDSLSSLVYVSTHMEDFIVVDCVYQSCLVVLGGFETRVNLFSMVNFDVILSMDWLSPYHAILDCHAKTVTLAMPGLLRLEWMGALDYVSRRVISFLKAHRMVEKGCNAYLAFVRDVNADTPTVESVSRRWLELLKDYDITILYHPGKANMVANALSRKVESLGCLAYLPVTERPLALEVQALAN
ncbi:uncharacterized protein [Nicotiana tomentosiformis]|uniref:uncharacterized protein n=1 Tax=Nicotiana tomentosiformis TaxID=4098 RepID=UPI00388CE03F